MSVNKGRGTRWETAIVRYLNEHGIHAERRALHGARDKGDVAGVDGVVIEAKNQNRISLAEWLDETLAETAHAGADLGVCWIHRRGRTSAGEGYVLMDGATFTRLLKERVR